MFRRSSSLKTEGSMAATSPYGTCEAPIRGPTTYVHLDPCAGAARTQVRGGGGVGLSLLTVPHRRPTTLEYSMRRLLLAALLATALAGCGGTSSKTATTSPPTPTPQASPPTTAAIQPMFQRAGIAIDDVKVYTAEDDPNHL